MKKLKPSDAVMKYLEEKVEVHQLPNGSRLPTAVHIATELGISEGTVKNVFRRLAKEGKIRMRAGDGSFWMGEPDASQVVYHFGINTDHLAKPQGLGVWMHRIFGGLLHRKLLSGTAVQFHICGDIFSKEAKLPEKLDGMFLLSLGANTSDVFHYNGEDIPCVALNPWFDDAAKNFVAPDYFAVSRRLGEIWRKSGRKKVLAILSPSLPESVSVRLRYGGLLCGLEVGSGNEVECRYLTTPTGAEKCGYDGMKKMLRDGCWVPDAVYAVGDLLAFGAIQALEEHGMRVPEDVSVVGGNGAHFVKYPKRFLSTTAHPLEEIGEELFRLLMLRVEQKGADVPASILASKLIAGGTTRPEENEWIIQGEEKVKNA